MSKDNNAHKAIDAEFVSIELDRLEPNEGNLTGFLRIPARYWKRSSTS